ncbi:DUF6119 family protein [Yoonia sp. R2-816]|uniref:DUF6119 family protein n=1 Tax=Yoonia sp. R2-816 TaxID=3342638 RepID=UPI00372A72E4
MPKTTFTLFLAKEVIEDFREYLTENAQTQLASPATQFVPVEDFGERAHVVVFRGQSSPPQWLTRLSRTFDGVRTFDTQSGAAIILFEMNERVFAVTFSHGWMFLDEDKFEADFGLRVAINALDQTKLKRLERANLGDALRGVSQSPFQRNFQSFGIDDVLDLVRKISGTTRDGAGPDAMTGSRSLKITGEYEITDIPGVTGELTELFDSWAYRNTAFRIIDFVQPISDGPLIRTLNELAVERIKNLHDNFELGLPSNSEAEGVSFKFAGPGLRNSFPDLMLRHYTASLGAQLEELSIEMINNHKIISIFDDNRPSLKWPIRKALVGSVDLDGARYAINEGAWFRIDDQFRLSVEEAFQRIIRAWDGMRPEPPMSIFDAQGNGTIEREEVYNARLAEQFGFGLLDQQSITIPNVARSGFEPCDLIDIQGRRFIHVKKSSRRSNILSHFFKQGSNSAQMFKKIPAVWTQQVTLLRDLGYEELADRLQIEIENGLERWTVEFWIVDSPRTTGEFNIPFFSKISLRDEIQSLNAMDYEVSLRFIRLSPYPVERLVR